MNSSFACRMLCIQVDIVITAEQITRVCMRIIQRARNTDAKGCIPKVKRKARNQSRIFYIPFTAKNKSSSMEKPFMEKPLV